MAVAHSRPPILTITFKNIGYGDTIIVECLNDSVENERGDIIIL